MGVNCLALVHFDKDLTGFILGVGGVRLESGDANFKAIAAVSAPAMCGATPAASRKSVANWLAA
jgi:hypothetical protein